MQLGMIGLGRMGNGLVRRLMNDGHDCVVYDHNEPKVKELTDIGATGSSSLADFASKLTKPRAAVLSPSLEVRSSRPAKSLRTKAESRYRRTTSRVSCVDMRARLGSALSRNLPGFLARPCDKP